MTIMMIMRMVAIMMILLGGRSLACRPDEEGCLVEKTRTEKMEEKCERRWWR